MTVALARTRPRSYLPHRESDAPRFARCRSATTAKFHSFRAHPLGRRAPADERGKCHSGKPRPWIDCVVWMCSSRAHDFPRFFETLARIFGVGCVVRLWSKRWIGTVEVTVFQRF